jgi:hypothetical protein
LSGTSPKVALHPDIAPLAIDSHGTWSLGPTWTSIGVHLVVEHRRDGVGLADLLDSRRSRSSMFEVGVATEIELVGPIEATPRP